MNRELCIRDCDFEEVSRAWASTRELKERKGRRHGYPNHDTRNHPASPERPIRPFPENDHILHSQLLRCCALARKFKISPDLGGSRLLIHRHTQSTDEAVDIANQVPLLEVGTSLS